MNKGTGGVPHSSYYPKLGGLRTDMRMFSQKFPEAGRVLGNEVVSQIALLNKEAKQ